MSRSMLLSKPATRGSLFVGAIAGSLLAASILPSGLLVESHATKSQIPESPIVESPIIESLIIEPQVMQLAPRSTPPEMTQDDRLTVMAIAFGSTAAFCLGLNAFSRRDRLSTTVRSASRANASQSDNISFNQASRSLQGKLLRLLHDDRKIADRLFKQAYLKHPGKAPNWYAEKVIYDLERDRGKI